MSERDPAAAFRKVLEGYAEADPRDPDTWDGPSYARDVLERFPTGMGEHMAEVSVKSVFILREEWFPVYLVDDDEEHHPDDRYDVDAALIERFEAALAEFEEVQELLRQVCGGPIR